MAVKKKVSVSELKAHALQLVESVRTQKKTVEIYKRGVLVAKLVPAAELTVADWVGSLEGQVIFHDSADAILEPISVKWDVNEE
jgi:prevent-host-death family protein